jgi:hypothetical protein
MQKDPVCGMMVDEKKTKLTSKHDKSNRPSVKERIRNLESAIY